MMGIPLGAGADALFRNQLIRAAGGDGWIEGLSVEIGSSASDIVMEVDGGACRLSGTSLEPNPTSIMLDSGEGGGLYRKDAIYIGADEEAHVATGEPDEIVPENTTGTYSALPQPPATDGLNGIVIAVVMVGPNDFDSGDIDEVDVQDRRVPAIEGVGETDVRTASIPISALDDGDFRASGIPIPAGATLEMLEWGVHESDAGEISEARTGIQAQFSSASGGVVDSTEGLLDVGDPIFSESTSSGEPSIYQFRVENDSGMDINPPEGVGASFVYRVID